MGPCQVFQSRSWRQRLARPFGSCALALMCNSEKSAAAGKKLQAWPNCPTPASHRVRACGAAFDDFAAVLARRARRNTAPTPAGLPLMDRRQQQQHQRRRQRSGSLSQPRSCCQNGPGEATESGLCLAVLSTRVAQAGSSVKDQLLQPQRPCAFGIHPRYRQVHGRLIKAITHHWKAGTGLPATTMRFISTEIKCPRQRLALTCPADPPFSRRSGARAS